MKFAKSILTGTGAVIIAALTLTLLAPKALHAVAATLVEIANPASNPVFNRDVDNPARTPYVGSCTFISPGATSECSIAVPSGQRFVVQRVSALYYFQTGSLALLQAYVTTNGSTDAHVFTPTTTINLPPLTSAIPDTPANMNADPGSTLLFISAKAPGSQPLAGVAGTVAVSGYLITP